MSDKSFTKDDIDQNNLFSSKTKEEKEEILPQMVKYALSRGIKSAARKYNAYPAMVRKWVNIYQEEGLEGLKIKD